MARNHARTLARARGFTLIELIIVIALISILTALAVGSLGTLTWNQRLNEVALEFYAAATKARAQSMRTSRNSVVQLLLSPDVANDEDIKIVAYFDRDGDYIYTEGTDELIHEHLINEQLLLGITGTPATTYGEQLVFDDAPDIDGDGSSDGATFITSKWDGTSLPRTILFNNQGFSYNWGASESEQVLHSIAIDMSDPVNVSGTVVKRLQITVAGAARLRTCGEGGVCK